MNNYKEQVLFEYELRKKVENIANTSIIPNFNEVEKFNPFHFDAFFKESINKQVDNTMANDEILFLNTDPIGRKYYLDCSSGLIVFNDNGNFKIALNGNLSSQYDIFDAAYFRRYLLNSKEERQLLIFQGNPFKEITTSDYLGNSINEVFSVPIIEFEAKSMNELNNIISSIEQKLSDSKFFVKLWFRGQNCEYIKNRSSETIEKLGLPSQYTEIPSLIPSIGRQLNKDNYNELAKQNMYWNETFKIWTLTQSSEFKDEVPVGSPLYNNLIKNLDSNEFAKYISEADIDISEYMFFQDKMEQDAQMLSTQQYGGLSSMLDITDDLDVALFFTQSELNYKTHKYIMCDQTSNRIIYVFAQGRNTGTIDMSKKVFSLATNEGVFNIPPRILNQSCGLLIGSNATAKNTYAYRIIAKIRINGSNITTTKTVSEMFPDMKIDSLYRTYFDAEPKLKGLYG